MIIKDCPKGEFRDNDWGTCLYLDEYDEDTFVVLLIPAEILGKPVQTMFYEFHGNWSDEDMELARLYINAYAIKLVEEEPGVKEIGLKQVDETTYPESMN